MATILGIDVSSETLDACALTEDGTKHSKAFVYSLEGCRSLVKWAQKHQVGVVVMEATGGYEQRAALALVQAEFPVKIINPSQVRNFARGIGKIAKTDQIDAYVIARFAQVVPLPETFRVSLGEIRLKRLVQRRVVLIEMLSAEKNRKSLADDEIMESISAIIGVLQSEVKRIESAMDEIRKEDPVITRKCEVLTKQKGIGSITALSLIALMPELGQINRKQAAALAGLAPIARDSGKMKGKRFISGGRFDVRRALYMPAWVSVQRDPEMRDSYERLVGKGKLKKVAIVAIMRKLLIRSNALLNRYCFGGGVVNESFC